MEVGDGRWQADLPLGCSIEDALASMAKSLSPVMCGCGQEAYDDRQPMCHLLARPQLFATIGWPDAQSNVATFSTSRTQIGMFQRSRPAPSCAIRNGTVPPA